MCACTETIHMCTHLYVRMCTCAHLYTYGHAHTPYTCKYCEIQPHRVSCRRNWPGKSHLWHIWAASSVWIPAANLSSEAATGSFRFPGCQIPVTSDPQSDRHCSSFLRGPEHCDLPLQPLWCEKIKRGLGILAAAVLAASSASSEGLGLACKSLQGKTLG